MSEKIYGFLTKKIFHKMRLSCMDLMALFLSVSKERKR